MKPVHTIKDKATKVVSGTVDGLDRITDQAEEKLEQKIAPVRERVSQRFPTLYLLATTFGLIATFTGIEQILLQSNLLQDFPWLILCLGIATLFVTGTLYKRLG